MGDELLSPPNMDSKEYESTLNTLVHLRLDYTADVTYESVREFLEDGGFRYAMCIEDANRRHGHYIVELARDGDLKGFRKAFKATVPSEFSGNKCYSLALVKFTQKMMSYVQKHKDIVIENHGFAQWYMDHCRAVSYEKYDKKKISVEIEELEIKYITAGMQREKAGGKKVGAKNCSPFNPPFGDEDYVREFLKIKVKYNQVINMHYLEQRLLMLRMKKDPSLYSEYASRVVERLDFFLRNKQ